MAKKPWFKFWPDKWLSDEKLMACSLAAQGLWMRMLCLMHKNDRRGFLQVGGEPVTVQQLSRMVGCQPDEVSRALAEIVSCGVPNVTHDGILFSRLMERDEHIREVRSQAGTAGAAVTNNRGPPDLPQQNGRQTSGKEVGKEVGKTLTSLSENGGVLKQNTSEPECELTGGAGGNLPRQKSGKKEFNLPPPTDRLPPEFDCQEFRGAWAELVQHRREIKHPLTTTTISGLVNKFIKWGLKGTLASIEDTIANGWQGLFQPKEDRHESSRSVGSISRVRAPAGKYEGIGTICGSSPARSTNGKAGEDHA